MSRIRTFVAIDVDAPLRRQVQDLIKTLSNTCTGVSWVAPQNVHLTLKFLGDVEDKDVYDVCRTVESAVAAWSPFRVPCRGVGAFPNLDRPRTVWLGLEDRDDRLAELQQAVENAFAKKGYPRETRPFRPHITIGRVRPHQRRLEKLIAQLKSPAGAEFGALPVEQCVVFSSELTPEGPLHTVMGRTTLARP